jgi:tRNA A-37 threonylcarbamoyl transferase component Bud32
MRWSHGEPELRARVEALFAQPEAVEHEVLRDSPRRRLVVLGDAPRPLLVKQYRLGSGSHALRERVKTASGRSPAAREWRALRALAARGVPVPEPLGAAALPGGDAIVVLAFVPARDLRTLFDAGFRADRALLGAIGRAVAALHAAGWVHGDLQCGNLLAADGRVLLVDLQRARRDTAEAARIADLGFLDDSLAPHLSTPDRVRVRAAALGLARPFRPQARAELRAVGRASEARARTHARARTRRALREGRRFARVRDRQARGLRLRELAAADLDAALAAHRRALAERARDVLKDDGRSRITAVLAGTRRVIVKEVLARGAGRRLADLFRGSPARRAFRGGHGLQARGVGSATPLAFVESRRFGVPIASCVVLEDLRPAEPADRLTPDRAVPVEVLDALARLAARLHAAHARHGDLKASHVFLTPGPRGLEGRLIDLEGVRFDRPAGEAERILALAQLNASLPDAFPADARRRAFALYAGRCRFESGSREALARVVAESLARRHRWSGTDCGLAQEARRTISQRKEEEEPGTRPPAPSS